MLKILQGNKYKYDQLMAKEDWIYDFEKLRVGMNLPNRNSKNIAENYVKQYQFILETF